MPRTSGETCTGKNNPMQQRAGSLNPPDIDSCTGCVTKMSKGEFVVQCQSCGPNEQQATGSLCPAGSQMQYGGNGQLACVDPSAAAGVAAAGGNP